MGLHLVPLYALFIDASLWDCWNIFCTFFGFRKDAEVEIEKKWANWRGKTSDGSTIVTASARACLDLFLQTKPFEMGSEILMSGINIPSFPFILRQHGLIPVPIDLDMATLGIDLKKAERAVNVRTKGIVAAHLHGARNDMGPVCSFAKKHGLVCIEDCAEAFCGKSYSGHKSSDLCLFSFGMIKTNTSFGGGIGIVRDTIRYDRMKALHNDYDQQRRLQYLFSVLSGLLIVFLQCRLITWLMFHLRVLTGIDYTVIIVPFIRSYRTNAGLHEYRFRPCGPLLNAMLYRLVTWNDDAYIADMKKLKSFTQALRDKGVEVPGCKANCRDFWLYPIYAPAGISSAEVCDDLWKRGVDAGTKSTELVAVDPPVTGPYDSLEAAPEFLSRVVYLPVHRGANPKELSRIADVAGETVRFFRSRQS